MVKFKKATVILISVMFTKWETKIMEKKSAKPLSKLFIFCPLCGQQMLCVSHREGGLLLCYGSSDYSLASEFHTLPGDKEALDISASGHYDSRHLIS